MTTKNYEVNYVGNVTIKTARTEMKLPLGLINAEDSIKEDWRGITFPMNKNEVFYAVVKPDNLASIRVVTKAGFKFIKEMMLPGTEPKEKIQFRSKKAADNENVVLLPIGIIEEHGPHMDLSPDIYMSYSYCKLLKRKSQKTNQLLLTMILYVKCYILLV